MNTTNIFATTTFARQERVLVVLVEFTEPVVPRDGCNIHYDGTIKKDDSYYNGLYFSTSKNIDNTLVDSARNYFREVSNQKLDLIPAEESYGTSNDGIIRIRLPYMHPNIYEKSGLAAGILDGNEMNRIMHDSLIEIGNKKCVNFSLLDNDNDTFITNPELKLVFVLASGEYPIVGDTSTYMPDPRLRECVSGYHGESVYLNNKSILANPSRYALLNSVSRISVICHELAHTMDAPDFYNNPNCFNMCCKSLMDGNYVHLDPWNKIKMGFMDQNNIINVNSSDSYTVNSIDLNDPSKYNVLKIPIINSSQSECEEYFLVENRQPIGFDKLLATDFCNSGIAIWHVKELKNQTFSFEKFRFEVAGEDVSVLGSDKNVFFNLEGNNKFGTNTPFGNSRTFEGTDSGISITVNSYSLASMSVTVKLPTKISNFKAVTNKAGKTTLSWDSVPNATQYEIIKDDSSFCTTNSNTFSFTDLTQKHSFKVIAKNSFGELEAFSSILKINNIKTGDVNLDGLINEIDLIWIQKYLSGDSYMVNFLTIDFTRLLAADVDGDGVITANDEAYIYGNIEEMLYGFPAGKVKQITFGDVSGDGLVTVAQDGFMIMEYIDGNRTFNNLQKCAADVNGDCVINSIDVNYVYMY